MGGFTNLDKVAAKEGLYVGAYGSEKLVVDEYGRMYINFDPGTHRFVDSVNGATSNGGLSWDDALASIDAANNKCSVGDTIWVAPGHVETITGTDITMDVAGVTVIGLGKGSRMPQIKHNHANAEVSIAADNVTWMNIRHSADVTDVKVAIEIEDGVDYCKVKGCVFDVVATGTDEFLVSVRTNDASNFATIEDNDFDMGLGAAVAAISFTKDTDGTVVRNNRAQGDYSTANINGITTLSTKLLIEGNLLVNGATGNIGTEPGIELVTGSTGIIRDNDIMCNLATMIASIVADACILYRNYYNEDLNPGTGAVMGTASAND